MVKRARASAAVVFIVASFGLVVALASPTGGRAQPSPRYRCSFAFEPDARRAIVVAATCQVCSSGPTERCGPPFLTQPSAWITTADGQRAGRRIRTVARTGGSGSDQDPVRVTLRAALAPGAYVFHFLPSPRAARPEFREPFVVDSARQVRPER